MNAGATGARRKVCSRCGVAQTVMYRCQVDKSEGWVFCCGPCLRADRDRYPDSYRYGGTWKARKR